MSAQRTQSGFAGGFHPNNVIARKELERQERSRLRRLSEVRPSGQTSGRSSGRSRERPSSAGRFSRPSSRPASGLSGHRQGEEFESLKSRVVGSPSSSPSRTAFKRGNPNCDETTARLRIPFMMSPQRRLQDASTQFQVSTAAQAQVLQEELQGWYFSDGGHFFMNDFEEELAQAIETGGSAGYYGGSPASGVQVDGCPWTTSVDPRHRPGVDALEEAAAAVKAKVAASGCFGPPPPMPGSSMGAINHGAYADRIASTPGRGASGGCRGVAAATANRQMAAGLSRPPTGIQP